MTIMIRKLLLAAALAQALLPAVALAQTPPPGADAPAAQEEKAPPPPESCGPPPAPAPAPAPAKEETKPETAPETPATTPATPPNAPATPITTPAAPAATPAAPGTVPNVPATTAAIPTPAGEKPDAATAPAPEKPKSPELKEEVTKVCASGNITMKMGARFYGWKFGDAMLVEMEAVAKKGAALDFAPLKKGALVFNDEGNKQFEVVGKPIIEEEDTPDGGKHYDIVMLVRQFMPSPQYVTFWFQLPYAKKLADNGTPYWEIGTSPSFTLAQDVSYIEGQKRPLTDGNTGTVVPRSSSTMPLLAIVMTICLLAWPAVLILRWVNRVRPRKAMSQATRDWLEWYDVRRSGKKIGFGVPHYRSIAALLKQRAAATYPGIQGMTLSEIVALPDSESSDTLKSVFTKLGAALQNGRQLTEKEIAELVKEVDALIPRPFTV
jgi:hypothetical protein